MLRFMYKLINAKVFGHSLILENLWRIWNKLLEEGIVPGFLMDLIPNNVLVAELLLIYITIQTSTMCSYAFGNDKSIVSWVSKQPTLGPTCINLSMKDLLLQLYFYFTVTSSYKLFKEQHFLSASEKTIQKPKPVLEHEPYEIVNWFTKTTWRWIAKIYFFVIFKGKGNKANEK